MLLVRIRESYIKYLTGIIVLAIAATVRIPLVGGNADVNTYRFNSQVARHVNDTIVYFRISDR